MWWVSLMSDKRGDKLDNVQSAPKIPSILIYTMYIDYVWHWFVFIQKNRFEHFLNGENLTEVSYTGIKMLHSILLYVIDYYTEMECYVWVPGQLISFYFSTLYLNLSHLDVKDVICTQNGFDHFVWDNSQNALCR